MGSYLLLWLGLLAGAVLGAMLFGLIGHQAIWVAAASALLLGIALHRRDVNLTPSAKAPRL